MKNPIKNTLILLLGAVFGGFLGMLLINVRVLLDLTEEVQGRFASIILEEAVSSTGQLFESIAVIIGFAMTGLILVYGLLQQKLLAKNIKKLDAAKESNKSKDAFVSMLLHYIRTPLAGIRWSLKSVIKNAENEDQKEQLQRSYDENLRALDAVEHLLEVSRTSVGKIAYTFEVVHMKELFKLISDTLEQMKVQADEKEITFHIYLADISNNAIKVDKEKIVNIVQTLVENAINYTPKGGAVIIRTEEQQADFVFSVTDTGIGVPKEDQEKIFLQFYRSENARRLAPDGFGVGLYLIKTFIKESNGVLWVESRKNKGSIFSFKLPLISNPTEKFMETLS